MRWLWPQKLSLHHSASFIISCSSDGLTMTGRPGEPSSHLHPEEQPLGSGLELQHVDASRRALSYPLELAVVWEDDQVLQRERQPSSSSSSNREEEMEDESSLHDSSVVFVESKTSANSFMCHTDVLTTWSCESQIISTGLLKLELHEVNNFVPDWSSGGLEQLWY